MNISPRTGRSRVLIGFLLALPTLTLLASCATIPVTGKRQIMLMSTAQEQQLGASSDAQIVAQYGLVQDEEAVEPGADHVQPPLDPGRVVHVVEERMRDPLAELDRCRLVVEARQDQSCLIYHHTNL